MVSSISGINSVYCMMIFRLEIVSGIIKVIIIVFKFNRIFVLLLVIEVSLILLCIVV